jgi:anaerobic magnesium-protoporphyrin IX monomethyl ester cyclase
MSRCDVLLVFPQMMVHDIGVEALTSTMFPLGLAHVAASLEEDGVRVEVVDMVTDEVDIPELVDRARRSEPSVVGISVSTVTYLRAVAVARAIKAWRPETLVVFGGAHGTVAWESVLCEESVDVVVIGEGEVTMRELVRAHRERRDFQGVAGIALRSNGVAARTRRRPFNQELDTLPMPAFHHFAPVSRYDAHPIATGRGCTYKCAFCAAGTLSGRNYRVRSPQSIVEEVKHVATHHGVDTFFFVDDTFTAIPERTYAICDLLKRKAPDIHWVCECRTNTVSPALLRAMARAGCFRLQFGIESGNQEMLNRVQKGTTVEQIEAAVLSAFEAGIHDVVGSFIIGLPGETYETALETISFALKFRRLAARTRGPNGGACLFKPFFSSLIPFPCIPVRDDADQLGITVLREDPYAFITDEILTHPRGLDAKTIRELVMFAELALQDLTLPELGFPPHLLERLELGSFRGQETGVA